MENGLMDVRKEEIRAVLFDGKAVGYDARKAKRSFDINPGLKKLTKALYIKYGAEVAQVKLEALLVTASNPLQELAVSLHEEIGQELVSVQ